MMHNEKPAIQPVWACLPKTRQDQVVVVISHMVQRWLTTHSPQQRQTTHNALDKPRTREDIKKKDAETTFL
jgi:hypothetical protein